jgi:hypothetical protein
LVCLSPHQQDFLKEFQNSFVSFGCGTPDQTFLIPYKEFEPFVKNMWTTQNSERMYWHVVIHYRDGRYLLAQPENTEKSQSIEFDFFSSPHVSPKVCD